MSSDVTTHREPDAELTALLRARGLRVTSARLVINRVLRARDRHLSAEDVHEAVAEALPAMSLPTVYATLDLFEDLGLVRRVHAGGGGPVRYDPRTEPHHHTVCRVCGRVEDFDGSEALDRALYRAEAGARAGGFGADTSTVVVSGRCRECRATGRELRPRPSPHRRRAAPGAGR
jgi:Fe2+ or Zn2+ uptake regulation protein